MDKPEVSLVCPAYHDEHNIGPLVRRSIEILTPVCARLEIIVVEDGSPDGTGLEVDKLSREFYEVTAFHHEKNRGHGGALKTGMNATTGDVIVLMDGDGQYEPLDIPPMLAMLDDADLVQGRRVVYPNGWKRFVISKLYNIAARTMFDVEIRDLGCSLKVFKRAVIEQGLPESEGIFMQGALVLNAHKSGFRVIEAEVMCYPRRSGRSSSMAIKNVMSLASDFLALRKNLRKQIK